MPKNLTKKDIKEVVVGALEPFAQAVQGDIQGVHVALEQMDKKWDLVAEQYYGIAQRLKDLEQRMERHSTQFAEIKVELKFIKADIAALKPQAKSDSDQRILASLEKRVAALEKARK